VGDPALARELGCFVAEGRLVVKRVLVDGRYRVRSLLVTPQALQDLADVLPSLPAEADVIVAGHELVGEVTGFNIHRGWLALMERPPAANWRECVDEVGRRAGERPGDDAMLAVLENVGNPDNIGGIFRNAAAFGVGAVLLGPGCSDPLYRKAIRTSMGASLAVPHAPAEHWPGVLDALRDAGWTVAALAIDGEVALDDWLERNAPPARIAWLLGHEADGLTAAARARAAVRVRIPMAPGTDSVNVATAAAIAFHATRAAARRRGDA
jgi:tRNA G18 (ribose-2'-O)-methylase SpoU